jgi:hypothetical protein
MPDQKVTDTMQFEEKKVKDYQIHLRISKADHELILAAQRKTRWTIKECLMFPFRRWTEDIANKQDITNIY